MRDYDEKPLILNSYDTLLRTNLLFIYLIVFVINVSLLISYLSYKKIQTDDYEIFIFGIINFLLLYEIIRLIRISYAHKKFNYNCDTKVVFKQYTIEFYEKDSLRRISEEYDVKRCIARPFFAMAGFLEINLINSILLFIFSIFLMYFLGVIIFTLLLLEFISINKIYKKMVFKKLSNSKFFTDFPIILLEKPVLQPVPLVEFKEEDYQIVKTSTSISLVLPRKDESYYGGSVFYSYNYFYVFIDSEKTYNELKFYFLSRFNMDIEYDIKKTFF